MNKISIKKVASITGLFLGAFAISVLAADWTPAGCAAPGCNTEAPINVSNNFQTKAGGIGIGGVSSSAAGYSLDVDGPGIFAGLRVTGQVYADSLKLIAPGFGTAGNVLTTDGTGVAEWKPAGGAGGGVSTVTEFSVNLVRNGGLKTTTTNTPYLFCALSRIDAEMGRVNAGSVSGAYCDVSKNANGTWKVSGLLNDDPDFTCKMTCFK